MCMYAFCVQVAVIWKTKSKFYRCSVSIIQCKHSLMIHCLWFCVSSRHVSHLNFRWSIWIFWSKLAMIVLQISAACPWFIGCKNKKTTAKPLHHLGVSKLSGVGCQTQHVHQENGWEGEREEGGEGGRIRHVRQDNAQGNHLPSRRLI